ncbi:jg7671 [Pararge aegeria aegeria]|uniref:Jg7671 protein n=3 Tax=Pararge aegeria TaxID=116150 RepID=A0A8S4QSI7_9NEOP|nr:jg7671 [Pararge aegeria aegeria]
MPMCVDPELEDEAMGCCCSRESAPDELVDLPPPARPSIPVVDEPPIRLSLVVDPILMERLIMEMLRTAAVRVNG